MTFPIYGKMFQTTNQLATSDDSWVYRKYRDSYRKHLETMMIKRQLFWGTPAFRQSHCPNGHFKKFRDSTRPPGYDPLTNAPSNQPRNMKVWEIRELGDSFPLKNSAISFPRKHTRWTVCPNLWFLRIRNFPSKATWLVKFPRKIDQFPLWFHVI